ncbi:hypothetical protein LZD49_35225, partial [Dyadobacter sp. CY261]|uniref:hypothetical protein n=1 Tax=Dyadobacter sp. CY261 TaxID=2907203 RepID=UPI001F44ACF0
MFTNTVNEKEIEVSQAVRDVVVYSDYNDVTYSLNYLRKGDASNATTISIYRSPQGSSFPTSFGIGEVSGIQNYVCTNPDNGDEVVLTIDWSLISTTNVSYFIDVSKSVFAKASYTQATKRGNRYIFENPNAVLTQSERKVLNGVVSASVRSTNAGAPTTYGINYITKGSASVQTRISLTINKGGTSFPIDYGTGVPSGVVEYKLVNPNNFDEIFLTLDWSKVTSDPAEQVFIAGNKATLHRSVYSAPSFLQREVYENPSAAFNYAEIETALALRQVSVQSVNPGTAYSLYYLQKGNASDPTIISIYNNSTATSFNLDAGVGVVSGVRKYTVTAPNYDKVNVVVDWDRMTTSGTASKYFLDIARSRINSANYFYTEWIERKVYEDPAASFNSAEIETVLALRDISVQSKNLGVYYSLYYIQKGDASNPTIISFYNNTTASSFNQSFGNGVPSGVQKYVINTSPNGDIVSVEIDWSKMSVSGLASKVFQNVTKTLINKSRYKDLFPLGITAPTLVLPTYVPYARGREFPVWKENLRVVSYANEADTRVDISGNDGSRTWLTPDVNSLEGWKYLRQISESVPANFNVTVTNKLLTGETLNSGTFQVRPTSQVFNSTAQKSILVIGDSHTEIEDRLVTRTLKALITANNSFIPTFIGTRAS